MEPVSLKGAVCAWLKYQKHHGCPACQVKLLYEFDDIDPNNGRLHRKGKMFGASFEAIAYVYGKHAIIYPPPQHLHSGAKAEVWKWNDDWYGHRIEAHQPDFFAILLEHIQYRENDYKVRYGLRNTPRPNWLARAASFLR